MKRASYKEIRDRAIILPRSSREKLLRDLIWSLAPDSKPESAWIAEAEARIDAYERGELETVSLEQFLKHISRPAHAPRVRQRGLARV